MIDLRKGDCIELMKDIPDKSIDLILCDLPYGITDCKWDIAIPFNKLWEQYNRIIKDRGCIALFGIGLFSVHLISSNEKHYKYDWIWDKNTARGHLTAKIKPMRQHENIHIFSGGKGGVNYYPIKTDMNILRKDKVCKKSEIYSKPTAPIGEIYYHWGRYPKTILTFKSIGTNGGYLHPTQKPVDLLEYLIKTYTLENDTVLDNCMGSGSTGVACINTNRNFIGMELDDHYFSIAENRINEAKFFSTNYI
jgi:site-specific DNA-methyltransferase (adenine-specific)